MYAGAFLAGPGAPSPRLALLILVAAVGARTCAMALNRILDRDHDARNPRTRDRELPAGRLSLRQAVAVAVAGALVLAAAAGAISRLCLLLVPVPVAVFFIYPLLKRVTPLAHVGVGLADALGPGGAWVAVRSAAGQPVLADAAPLWWLLAFTVVWIAGFDVIYATQDEAFDRTEGLRSIPASLGRDGALLVSGGLHVAAGACLAGLFLSAPGGWPGLAALILAAALLIAEHERAAAGDLAFAFFWANAGISLLVFGMAAAGTRDLAPPSP